MRERIGTGSQHGGPLAAALVVGLFLAIAAPVIISGFEGGRGAWDSVEYHEPAIRVFAAALPSPDLSDYASATTPGYHLVLSVFARVVSDSTMALQFVGSLFTVALLALVAWWSGRRVGWLQATFLCLPLLASMYALYPGIWLLPDNLAWLGVLSILLLAIARAPTARTLLAMGAILLGLVLVRQIHLWAACIIWTSAWLGVPDTNRSLFDELGARARRVAIAVGMTLPAFLAVAWFVRLWGGLSPPRFQEKVQGANLSTPAFMLMEFAILSVPLTPFIWRNARKLPRRVWCVAMASALVAIAFAAIPETTWSTSGGRYSGWWNLVRQAPVLGGRTSVVVLVLAPVGAFSLVVWLASAPWRTRILVMATLAGFLAAQTASHNAWQRYHEPLLLLLLVVLGSAALGHERQAGQLRPAEHREAPSRALLVARLTGGAALSLLLAALMARSLFLGSEVEPEGGRVDTGVSAQVPGELGAERTRGGASSVRQSGQVAPGGRGLG